MYAEIVQVIDQIKSHVIAKLEIYDGQLRYAPTCQPLTVNHRRRGPGDHHACVLQQRF